MKTADTRLIELLSRAPGGWALPDAIERQLGLSRRKLQKLISALESEGYHFETHPYLGFRIVEGFGEIDREEIAARLRTKVLGTQVTLLDTVGSTQDAAMELAEQGAPDGTVVLAEEQTKGRGRFKRRWVSARGMGVYMSVILGMPENPQSKSLLTVTAAIAVAEAISTTHKVPALLRWPNDVVCHGRKLAGVLVEARTTPDGRRCHILGIGINTAQNLPLIGRKVTSVGHEQGKYVDRTEFVIDALESLDRWYRILLHNKIDTLGKKWIELSADMNQPIRLRKGGHVYEGRVVEISPISGITLQLAGGGLATFKSEQVTLVE